MIKPMKLIRTARQQGYRVTEQAGDPVGDPVGQHGQTNHHQGDQSGQGGHQ